MSDNLTSLKEQWEIVASNFPVVFNKDFEYAFYLGAACHNNILSKIQESNPDDERANLLIKQLSQELVNRINEIVREFDADEEEEAEEESDA